MPESRLTSLLIFGTIIITVFAVGAIIFLIIQKQRQIRNRLARQKMEFEYSQSLLDTRIEVQETTLTMLSQELHDNVNQMLSACVMQVSAAEEFMQHDVGNTLLENTKTNIKGVISNVRLLSHSLATGMVERRELGEAIQAELSRIEAFSGIKCSLQSLTFYELQPDQRLLLFRIVQEALHNVLKHANARHISVNIDAADGKYILSVADDGAGFDTNRLAATNSLGLTNMRNRVDMLKGTMNITSLLLQGTTIVVEIPIDITDE